jgi:uncharacterized repeat protein (TIGR02543 family)
MYTRLYCYGSPDDDGNELHIMSVNPTGKPYIDNFDYFYRLGYTKEFVASHPELFVKTTIWRDSNYYDAQDLYDDGIRELEKIAQPVVDITITSLDISAIGEGNNPCNLAIGDCVRIVDEDLGLNTLCNVIKREINYEEPHILNITVTNSITYHDTLSKLFTNVNTVSSVVTSGGHVIGSANMGDVKDYLNLNYLNSEQIDAKYVKTETLEANYITADEIKTNYLDAESIGATYATIGNLDAVKAQIKDLNVDVINGKLADFEDLFADNADFHNLVANKAEIEDLKAGNITVAGKLKASEVEIDTIKATYVQVGSFEAYKATVENLYATNAEITNLKAQYIDALLIETNSAKIEQLNTAIAQIETLEASMANIETLVSKTIITDNLETTQATIDNLNAKLANIDKAIIDIAEVEDLRVANAKIELLNAEYIDAVKIDVDDLNAKSATIEQLNAYTLRSEFGEFQNLTAENFKAANASIGSLDANVANINSVLAGNVGTGLLQTVHLTADNVVIDDAVIKSANIENIDTDVVTVGNDNIILSGSTQQFKDSNGNVRVQIGQDAQGDFNFIIADEDGATVINADGVTENAIPDGLIVDKMVANNAGIQASKVNYIDKDGNKTLQTVIEAEQGRIETLIKETTIEGEVTTELENGALVFLDEIPFVDENGTLQFTDKTLDVTTHGIVEAYSDTKLKDAYLHTVETVDGIQTTIADVQTNINGMTSKITTIEATADGLKTEVSKVETDLKATKSIAEQTSEKFTWLVKSGTNETDFTLTDRTAELVSEQINLKGLVTFTGLNSELQDNINLLNEWTSEEVIEGGTAINGGYIQTHTIKSQHIDTENLFSSEAVIDKISSYEINAERITSGKIKSNFIELNGLEVKQENTDIVTFAIENTGDITLRGSVESYNYVSGESGWSINKDGGAEFNDVIVRGSLITDMGGIADMDSDQVQVLYWAGTSHEERENAPFIVYSDGSMKATKGTFGGVFTGDIEIGNISIIDPSSSSGNDAILTIRNGDSGIKRIQLRDTGYSNFAQDIWITDNFDNPTIQLNQSGYVNANGGYIVNENSLTSDGLNIGGATIFGDSDNMNIISTLVNIGTYNSDSNLKVFGDVTVDKNTRLNKDLLFGNIVIASYTDSGIDFNFIDNNVTFTVTFVSNGGSSVAPIRNVALNSKITQPNNPTRHGYSFNGWYKDSLLNVPFNFSTDVIEDNTTLYAKWTMIPAVAPTYTVTYGTSDRDEEGFTTWSSPYVINAVSNDGGTLSYHWEVDLREGSSQFIAERDVFANKTTNNITVDELNKYVYWQYAVLTGKCTITNTKGNTTATTVVSVEING